MHIQKLRLPAPTFRDSIRKQSTVNLRIISNAARRIDYYQILEVDNNATHDEIKAAYRRLARKWHPDVNRNSPEAANIFKNLATAFETLSDHEKRIEYDHSNASYGSNSGSYASSFSYTAPAPITAVHSISFMDSILGSSDHQVTINTLSQCSECKGSGGAPGGRLERCQICRGRGEILKTKESLPGSSSTSIIDCPACIGRGILIIDCCHKCGGTGLFRRPRAVSFATPAGIEHGTTLRLVGKGDAGECGSASGDVLVTISVLPDHKFSRKGLDIHSEVKIPLTMAILGGTILVPSIGTDRAELKIPPGTPHGAQISLRDRGVLGKGSHHVKIRVEVPQRAALSEQQDLVLKRLAEYYSNHSETYR